MNMFQGITPCVVYQGSLRLLLRAGEFGPKKRNVSGPNHLKDLQLNTYLLWQSANNIFSVYITTLLLLKWTLE